MSVKRATLIAIIGVAIGALVLYDLGRWDAHASQESQSAIQSAKAWLAAGNARRADRARLLAIAADQAARAHQLEAEARTHAASDVALNDALDRATTAVDSLPIVVAQRDSARASVASWAQAFAALTLKDRADSVRADRAEAAADSAAARLRALLKVADCRVLGLSFAPPCPSRALSFVVGAGAGAIAILTVRH